ncbi:glycosyltransferase family 4 protein [Frankia sp. R82]|uniref:glycosyltransferase family 4 protein n=1 Tax=Frankia sp. R82 TaxID=2950553 RepID=UPI0020446FA2|nr:glycosyltransferase family 4 protein [Frankia sp. R82]MCM3884952.1 glycosyltransferase family 4 protein [Frankia sp. R82]
MRRLFGSRRPLFGDSGAQRIVFVYDAVYPWVKGGAERRYHALAKELAGRGHDVHWYGMQYWSGPSTVRIDGIAFHGVCKARPLYTESGRRSISQALIFGAACLRMILSGGLSGAQVVDCCGFPFFSLFSVWLVTRLRGQSMVVTCHEVWGDRYWTEYLGAAGRVGALVERTALRLPRQIIAVSEDTRDRLSAEIGVSAAVTVVPNGVDLAVIDGIAAAEHPIDVLYVGRLCDFKNVDLLLEALAVLVEERPEVRCDIIGDGPDRARLETRAVALGLADNVRFRGFLAESDEVYARMKAATVLVLPSTREGFGMVVIEANAAGVPVVVADYPANAAKHLITGRNGTVSRPDPEAFAAALAEFLGADADHHDDCRSVALDHDWAGLTTRWRAALA